MDGGDIKDFVLSKLLIEMEMRGFTVSSIIFVIFYLSWWLCHTVHLVTAASTVSSDNDSWKSFLASDTYKQIYSDVPTLFSDAKDVKYDRYAACLAATEGLRRIRDRDIIAIRKRRAKKEPNQSNCLFTKQEKQIQAQFINNSKRILDMHGMSPREFASLSKKLIYDEDLKQKVIEQAYLYRVASSVQADRWTLDLCENKDANILVPSTTKSKTNADVKDFSECLQEIERMRFVQIERLRRSLCLDLLPDGVDITDPKVLPLLNPKVRAVVNAFPLQAEEIIKKYDFDVNEFNKLLKRVKSNFFFRWRVRSLGNLGKR